MLKILRINGDFFHFNLLLHQRTIQSLNFSFIHEKSKNENFHNKLLKKCDLWEEINNNNNNNSFYNKFSKKCDFWEEINNNNNSNNSFYNKFSKKCDFWEEINNNNNNNNSFYNKFSKKCDFWEEINNNNNNSFHNKFSRKCDFPKKINNNNNANGLLQRKMLDFQHQPHRNFSELPQMSPPRIQYEGLTKILVDSPPVNFAQESLIWIHSEIGLPWWSTLVLVTIFARTLITLPSALYTQYILAKTANLKWEMDEIVKDLKHEANYRVSYLGYSEPEARVWYNKAFKEKWEELIVRDNCHPAKGFVLVLTQLPLWIFLSAGTRNLCFMLPYQTPKAYNTFMELSTEGFGWISNLTAADPYYILPITMGIFNLCNVEFHNLLRPKSTLIQKVSLNVFRGLTLVLVPIAAILPSGISLYWTASSAHGLVQNLIVVSPKVRRACRIEWTDQEIERPYTQLWSTLKERLSLGKNKKIEAITDEIFKKSSVRKK